MRCKAIIHLDNFENNINAVRSIIGPDTHICVPVKADAYGHGAPEIAKKAVKTGVFCLGVATVQEGTELRKAGITCPILLFTQAHPAEIPEIFAANLTPFVSDVQFASKLNEYAAAEKAILPVHLKIDTGMGRIGCNADSALSLAKQISEYAGLKLAGTATHFADSERDRSYTKQQTALFIEAVKAIKSAGIDPGIVHAANSGAVLQHPETANQRFGFDMVRPGILLYGYGDRADIKPVMEFRTVVSLIKKVKKGESVSYGRTWTAPQDTNIAVLSAGYADGFPRAVGNMQAAHAWQVLINGTKYPVVGRICMDQCCVDIGNDNKVNRWDEAVIFGGDAPDAAALAEVTGTIPYEITCNINKRVPREYQ